METLHGEGIKFILYLQQSLHGWTKEMLFLSHSGDPRNSFLVYFPIAYHCNSALGLLVLWVSVLSEWLNLVLKWVLRGERPYWWVHESHNWRDIELSQYPLTCETGPGSPSGHVMVTASVLCTMTPFIATQLCRLLKTRARSWTTFIIHVMCWLLFTVFIVMISISRLFIATHFPHQVVLGAIVGVALSFITTKELQVSKITGLAQCGLMSLILACIALAMYFVLSVAIFDPSASVSKAQSWCISPDYVHLDTTPFYSLVRDTGALFGIGVASLFANIFAPQISIDPESEEENNLCIIPKGKTFFRCFTEIILSVSLLQLLEYIGLPIWDKTLFYMTGFIKNVIVVVIVVFVVPFFTCNFSGEGNKSKTD